MNTAPAAPQSEFVYEALVDIAASQPMGASPLGASPLGERYIVPILGGTFEGPRLRGVVLPGGADRQLWRADGVRVLEALYEMRTDDGAVLTVFNRVLIDQPTSPDRYAMSQLQITAPQGPHAWLNRRVFVGTLHRPDPAQPVVAVRVYQLV